MEALERQTESIRASIAFPAKQLGFYLINTGALYCILCFGMNANGSAEGRLDGERLEARRSSGTANEPELSTVMCPFMSRGQIKYNAKHHYYSSYCL